MIMIKMYFLIKYFVFTSLFPVQNKQQLQLNADNTYTITLDDNSVKIRNAYPLLYLSNKVLKIDTSWVATKIGKRINYVKDNISISLNFENIKASSLEIATSIENKSKTPLKISYISPLNSKSIVSDVPLNRYLKEGELTWSQTALLKKNVSKDISTSFAAFTNTVGKKALLFGFTNLSDARYELEVTTKESVISSISARCDRELIPLNEGETIKISNLKIIVDKSLSTLMSDYADLLSQNMGYRNPKPSVTGWSSWYYYYTHAEREYIYQNLETISSTPKLSERVKVFQLDDGWFQTDANQLHETFGDYESGFRYPEGMKKFANNVKKEGLVPGLWVAPFLNGKKSKLFKNRPDLMVLKRKDSTPINVIDVSSKQSEQYLTKLFSKLSKDWGIEYLKIDFLGAALKRNDRYIRAKPNATSIQSYRKSIDVIRNAIGEDTYLLGCGAPITASIGLFDGMRIGHDISTRYFMHHKDSLKGRDYGFISVKLGANQTIWRHWMQRKFWQNDPDCLVVRDYGGPFEVKRHNELFPWTRNKPFGLSFNEAKLWSDLIWFTGGVNMMSTDLEKLINTSPDRYKLLLESMPVNERSVCWVDWYVEPDFTIMETTDDQENYMLAVFNRSDNELSFEIPRELTRLKKTSWEFKERLLKENFKGKGDKIKLPKMPPRSSKIWVLH